MKERGIIFNGEMVRATLDGLKTQTRRVVRHQPDEDGLARLSGGPWMDTSEKVYRCPYGQPGDRLWVREAWGVVSHELDDDGRIQPWAPDRPAKAIHEMPFGNGHYSGFAIYSADGEFAWGDDDGYEDGRSCWKPSIHMPRAASRILLEITDVRVESLHGGYWRHYQPEWTQHQLSAKGSFATLWKSIYGAESWNENPWVWAISFKRIEGA
ncbi:hypothetical protein EXT57_05160 [Pectobacterium brasiliense]|uniref:hypothetical protein n=1 Tax=Pectobacterium brasiliense TaxID=180957 RepID=UPI00202D861B|nr:hypothetical protein [Pectobacterium brasiliense]MCL6376750.1 hypothetical protein [Pectobacterium brasiliense]